MAGSGAPPLRVERVLQLLPDVDALTPLRAFLVSTSTAQPISDPYATVGKREVQPSELRALVPRAVEQVTAHLHALYGAAVEALDAEQRGALVQVVDALVRAGTLEEGVGRHRQARSWYRQALGIAEGLRDRRPEIHTLRCIGRLECAQDNHGQAARFYQRSLALAEAEFDAASVTLACEGLGQIHIAGGRLQGAQSWFTRGLQDASTDLKLKGPLYLGLGAVERLRDHPDAAAEHIQQAHALFEQFGDEIGIIRALNERAQLDVLVERYDDALGNYREALARLHTSGADPQLEMTIRLNLCRLHYKRGRFPDAEDEMRRAEEKAIVHNFTHHLARVYLLMGEVRGAQGDDTGFIFFEKAVELCRGPDPALRLEAEVYLRYGKFRLELGDREEGRAYLERARDVLSGFGTSPALAEVEAELAQFEMA